ncbi:patatin-like phospholipase family protein [Hydrogenophaga sp.]|uniref:patatin-like phospholipase family protein n=1 Tax=Hydrogenophaga sp. TaxID=1904254 RepID=UPI002725AAD3|nr:patatin-like phospholipase family protein [Hydrogenophaga sp.]MDO8905746.1 patatin-like phospholipase family protein [Hydrogenophaga sp.]
MSKPPHPRPRTPGVSHRRMQIDLALQGGGSHGAFTWGVLDRLLEEDGLEIAAISGTSAGAMNAVALAAGLMDGGREGAQRVLRNFWQRVSQSSPFHHLQSGPLGTLAGPAADLLAPWIEPWKRAASLWGQQFSPYQLNPLNLNPLHDILVDTVDFERVRQCDKTQLFIAATQVRTGALRVFDQSTLNADMVMASACLPLMFQAVEIDGEGYWDGGYAGNPSLMPLIAQSAADDLLLVQINPIERAALPTRAGDILDRINEVTFNASLVKEMRSIALLKQLIGEEGRPAHAYRNPLFQRVDALRVHLIDGGASLAPLGADSKSSTQWAFLLQLHDLGVKAADSWLEQHGDDIGVRSSLDLSGALVS